MAKLSGPVQVIGIGDTHTGSTMGLMPKGFIADDGNEIQLNPLQEMMLDHWSDAWKRIAARKIPTVIIFMADMIDGNHHGTSQLWTTDDQQMVKANVQILKPKVDLAHSSYMARGTPAHTGVAAKYDNEVAQRLGCRKIDGQPSSYHLRPTISGVLFDIAHHGPGVGKKIWNRNNSAISFAKNILLTKVAQGLPIPQVIMRAHVHQKVWETVREPVSGRQAEMIITPAWQWCTEFKHKIDTENDISDVGLVSVIVDSGKVLGVEMDCIELQQSKGIVA